MLTLSKRIIVIGTASWVITLSFSNIFVPLYAYNADESALPFEIVEQERQRKGGSLNPLTRPKYALFVVKAVLRETSSELTETKVKKTLQALLRKVLQNAQQSGEQIDGVSAFLYASRDHIAGGSIALGRIEWWPKGHSFNPKNVVNIENKATYVEKIDVFFLPKVETKQEVTQAGVDIVGTWIDTQGIPHTIIIRKRSSDYVLEKRFRDGSGSEKVLVVKRVRGEERFYGDPDNPFGDYMVIKKDGRLAFYDNEGFIYAFPPAKSR